MSPLAQSDALATQDLLSRAHRAHCICHRNPDGDAIGSLLGIGFLLESAHPHLTVSYHCKDPVPETFHFLPGAFRVQGPPPVPRVDADERTHAEDVYIIVDCAESKLTEMDETHPQLFDGTFPIVCIDHHPMNPGFGTVNIILPDAASTCEIIVQLADALQWTMDSDIATCLLTGVYTDTGGLLHSNTTAQVYRTVARLLREGARRQEIVTAVFRTAKLSTLQLWGRVLEKIVITEEGGAISAVTEGDFRATGAAYSELTGAIDYVNAVPGMRFSLILSEKEGKVKGSLRTLRDDVDVSQMAGRLSGGGHKKAAGFAVAGKLKPEVRWKVIEAEEDQRDAVPKENGA
ncbi:MAG: bifunctional oligoribonuclease/PAP phosphatase NrnA [Candidatus Peregrinibacteria bacterium]|nr:bifunctional oligoribonuclease/PAP phosphatase NrnA [Candidatus Peregrinibacteria bacterium]